MDEIALLGNAAAVPVIITITQVLKKYFTFKGKSEVITLLVSLVICCGWSFYTTPEIELSRQWNSGLIPAIKSFIDLLIISFATWLSAGKLYDLGYGKKKQQAQFEKEKEEIFKGHVQEKKRLEEEVVKLKTTNGGLNEPIEEDPEVASKLRAILEGK